MSSPLMMGIVNVTPDSFSDGGRFIDADKAIEHGRALIGQGADILDIGGESTRPGAAPVPLDEELRRVMPVVEGLVDTGVKISIDTRKPEVATAAIEAGATIWNDVSALEHTPDSLAVAAVLGCEVILMHAQGTPQVMQDAPHYDDVVSEVSAYLADRVAMAVKAGIARDKIWIDPGIGFGKTTAHNLSLLAGLDRLSAIAPVLLGASRKRFIAAIDPVAEEAEERLGGSIAAALAATAQQVIALRVHDVAQTRQAVLVHQAIMAATVPSN